MKIEVSSSSRTEISYAQRRWIGVLEKISIQYIRLADTWQDGVTPGKRIDAREYWRYPYQYRVCLHNEIPYDLDVKDYDLLKICLKPLLDFLDSEKIPYVMAGSGGTKSIHVQIFFKPSILCVRYGWKEVREALWEWILNQAEIPVYMRGLGKYDDETWITKDDKPIKVKSPNKGINFPYDKSVANFSDLSKGRVMRDFGGYREGRYNKTLLIGRPPRRREDIYNGTVRFPYEVKLWNPEKIILQELEFDYRLKYPPFCIMCPVSPEWMIQYESQDPDRIHNYPRICRQCGIYRRE